LSILDVKRGDIGSTMNAYARAYLSDDSVLRADAITLSPYLGFEALRPALDLASDNARGVFVLARTSNPEGAGVQLAQTQGACVAQTIIDQAKAENERAAQPYVGVVVGATETGSTVNLSGFNGLILAPGIGTQGGTVAALKARLGDIWEKVLPTASREIANIGPEICSLRDKVAVLLSQSG
jgi:orotidine-5'-phosphate decarboxylase